MKSIAQIDKAGLLRSLRDRVDADLAALVRRQLDIQEGATHAESRSEHAKDTRATEQSYLARGLANRVVEARRVAGALANSELPRVAPDDPIAVLCLVAVREAMEDQDQIWWLVPGPAGVEISQDDLRVQTVTPAAPLGRALIGLRRGDEGSLASPSGERTFEIVEIA